MTLHQAGVASGQSQPTRKGRPVMGRDHETIADQLDRVERNRDKLNAMKQVESELLEDMLAYADVFVEGHALKAFVRQYAQSRKIKLEE